MSDDFLFLLRQRRRRFFGGVSGSAMATSALCAMKAGMASTVNKDRPISRS